MTDRQSPGAIGLNWLGDRTGWVRAVLAVLSGLAIGAGQPPFSLLPLALAGLTLSLFLMLSARRFWRAAFAGWLAGTANFALSMSWLVEPFLVDVARHGWMAPFALTFMSGGLALFWGLGFGLAWRLVPSVPARALLWAATMGLMDLARGYVLTGFPWGLIGYLWSETPVLNLASVTGIYGLSVLTFLAVAFLSFGLVLRGWSGGVAALALGALLFPLGATLRPAPADLSARPMVRLVQPNAAQHQKWNPDYMQMFYDRQIAYTAAPADRAPALTVWPETAIPWRLEHADAALEVISDKAGGRPVVLGARRRDDILAYNSLVLTGSGGTVEALYDKARLVPFGEFIPFGGITRAIGLRSFASQDGFGYTPGPGPRTFDIPGIGAALPLICYEAIFPQAMQADGARPALLLQITNDAWFGTVSGPYQHLVQARTRAIEQGLPMIRAANTGISAVIDPAGRVLDALPLGEAGYLDAPLPPPAPPTVYARTGDLPVLLLVLGGLILIPAFGRVRNTD